jgi:carbon-monoxide dehydrogenase medium subunit
MAEAMKVLAKYGDGAAVLAGGTDLVPKINYYELKPEAILFIGNLNLGYIKQEDGKLVIGAGTTWAELLDNDLVQGHFSMLADATSQLGSVAIRTTGTIGGNIATASPAADSVPPLLAMDAELVLVSEDGERTMPLKDFFTGPGETLLEAGELIKEIHVPLFEGKTAFLKLGRRKAQTTSIANVAVRLAMDGDTCTDARIVVGSMAPTVIRCLDAESLLKGKTVDEGLIAEAAEAAVAQTKPIDDQRASAWYQMKAGKALVARALAQAAGLGS